MLLNKIDTEVALKVVRHVINDQESSVRSSFIKQVTKLLPSQYAQNKAVYDSLCSQPLDREYFGVRKLQFELMTARLGFLDQSEVKQVANDLVVVLATEMRAMCKDMRVFSSDMLVKITPFVPSSAIQMMQKQSYLQPAPIAGDSTSKPEQLDSVVTGILLMMLEDDSMAVRLAGIRAMSCYGQACAEIRPRCLTLLIDMLNDEINDVRIGALHGILGFNKVLTLNDYEVDTVLFNLNEDNPRLREEIYNFFAATTVSSGSLFQKIIDKLFSNLVKFEHQGETEKIFCLCHKLGQTHSRLVSSLYLKMLNIDKRFLAKEPDWTDSVYIAKMILIYSASQAQSHQRPLLEDAPTFFSKHLNYLSDKYPCYFSKPETQMVEAPSPLLDAQAKMLARCAQLFSSKQGRAHVMALTKNSYN